jgi:hypothetical protein
MNTTAWGPSLWTTMFMMASNYPVNVKNDLSLKVHYKRFYTNLKYMLPCEYCRKSYVDFLKELPIEPFLDSRTSLLYWVYNIKDKVNKKLIAQQKILIQEIQLSSRSDKQKKEFLDGMFITKPSPPFHKVCKYYEQFRATCSPKTQSCSIPVHKFKRSKIS